MSRTVTSEKRHPRASCRPARLAPFFVAIPLVVACVAPAAPPKPVAGARLDGNAHCDGEGTCAMQCEQGKGESCAAIARAALEGSPPDPTGAAPFAKRACDQGFVPGCTLSGQLTLEGRGVTRDVGLGVALLRHACDEHDADACGLYGNVVEGGYAGVEEDVGQAHEAYARGCEGGSARACSSLERLWPPPLPVHMREVRCSDPVEGVWVAELYRGDRSEWYTVELTMRRAAPASAELLGQIAAHYWSGGPHNPYHPDCGGSAREGVATMRAKGDVHGARIHFDGASPEVRISCGADVRYTPDRFDGALAGGMARLTWRDDTKPDLEIPVIFRRASCLPQKK